MTDPPNNEGEVPQRFLDLIDEILAEQSPHALPASLDVERAKSAMPKRVLAYGAAAAAVVVAMVGIASIQESDVPAVDTERAAIPTLPATSSSSSEGAGNVDQLALDTEVAAGLGLSLGPQVYRDDGSFVLADQPDLTPVYDRDALVGYALRGALDPDDAEEGFVVYGPDGATVRGVFDLRVGFVPTPDSSPDPGD